MLFNSFEYIFLFVPITFSIYFFLNYKKLYNFSNIFLVISSLFFYSWWNVSYLPLFLTSISFNYILGLLLIKKKQRFLLILGITINLMTLGYFKYFNFLIDNINFFVDTKFVGINLVLPLAISFFTFQQIAFLVDSYRGDDQKVNFLNYLLFVTFFPHLIAGPIIHHKEMIPQFSDSIKKILNYENIARGIFLFTIGIFKKTIIADKFSSWANTGFDQAQNLSFVEGWATSLSYTFQLYFDFSGYSDMAIGIALIFNIILPINFNSPYKCIDIQDFWRSWHITLGRFLRDYIYIPLGGNKGNSIRLYSNLIITFLIGGLWHGANWTFVAWGLLHGVALVVCRIWKNSGLRMNSLIGWFLTFNFVNIAWVFFRAKEWDDAIKILKAMFGFSDVIIHQKFKFLSTLLDQFAIPYDIGTYTSIKFGLDGFIVMIFGFILIFLPNSKWIQQTSLNKIKVFILSLMFVVALTTLNNKTEFLYFDF